MPDPTLASLAEFKAWGGPNFTKDTEDELIEDVLASVTEAAQHETGRPLFLQTLVERIDGRGGFVLAPTNPPVSAVNSLLLAGVAVPQSNGSSSGWLIGPRGSYVQLIGMRAPVGPLSVLDYVGGFAVIPKLLKVGALHQAKMEYEERQHTGMTSKGLGTAQAGGFLNVEYHPQFLKAIKAFKLPTY